MSKHKKSGLFLLAMLFAVVLTPIRQLPSWARQVAGQKSATQDLKEQYPVADPTEPESSDPKERAHRQKRNKRYNQGIKAIGPQIVQTADGYHWPPDFAPLPVSLSDAIIVGRISDAKAHLSEDKNSVYSEFAVRVDQVLKSTTGDLVPGVFVTTDRKGGQVRYPSGQMSWLFVVGQGTPRLGETYLLFLKKTDDDQVYSILTGYEIKNSRIDPLDYAPGVVGFERYAGSDPTVFLTEVRNVIAKCSTVSGQ